MEEVLLKIKGNMLGIFPTTRKIIEILSPIATFMRRMQEGRTQKMVSEKLFEIDEDGIFNTFSGLEHKIVAKLQSHGYKVYIDRLLKKKLPCNLERLNEEDLNNLADRDDQVSVLGLVVDNPGGFIVDCPTGWGKSYSIGQICKVLPRSNIAVVAPGKDVTSSLYSNLKRHIRDVGRVGDGYRDVRRITVSTMESIDRLAKVDWDLLLFDEVHRAGSPATANSIASVFHTAKCVGFSASPTGRSDGGDLVVEALFGKVIYKVRYQDAQSRGSVVPLRVYMFELRKGPYIGDSARVVTRNRKGIWENEYRNEKIAEIARTLPDDQQSLIMVETANHALQLKKLLPEYSVVFSSISNKSSLKGITGDMVPGLNFSSGAFDKKYREKLKNDFESGKLKKAIATRVWSAGVDFKQLGYLIRAEGAASAIQSIQTPGRLSRTFDGKECGIMIDFIDAFNHTLFGRSTKRKTAYTKAGWEVIKIDEEENAVDQFTKDIQLRPAHV